MTGCTFIMSSTLTDSALTTRMDSPPPSALNSSSLMEKRNGRLKKFFKVNTLAAVYGSWSNGKDLLKKNTTSGKKKNKNLANSLELIALFYTKNPKAPRKHNAACS